MVPLIALVIIALGATLRNYRTNRWIWLATLIASTIAIISLYLFGLSSNSAVIIVSILVLVGVLGIDILRGIGAFARQPRVGAAILALILLAALVIFKELQALAIILILGTLAFRLLLAPVFKNGGGGRHG